MTDAPLLSMRDIRKQFGATLALSGVDLELRVGQVLALIGENGAGKSTLMKVLSGAIPPDSGEMRLAGSAYRPRGPADALGHGVSMIYQELNLAPELTVEDNIMLGREARRWRLGLDRAGQRPRVRAALDQLGHPELHPDRRVGSLSMGARQLVEIARALVFRSRLLVFDEPTSSLTQHDAKRLFQVIGRLRDAGLGVIYISHFLEEIREVCDVYSVLRDGQSVGQGRLSDVSEAEIVAQMVGRRVDELFPPRQRPPRGEVLLHLDGVLSPHLTEKVSLDLHRGEILGLAGLVGAGRTELVQAIYGLDEVVAGRIQVAQVERRRPFDSATNRTRAGVRVRGS